MPRWRTYLLCLFVFSLPLQTRLIVLDPSLNGGVWEYGRVSLYGWDIILVLLAVLSWRPLVSELRQVLPSRHRAVVTFLLLVALGFFTTLWAPSSILVLYWGWRLLEAGAVWLLFRALQPRLQLVWLSLAASGLVQGLWAIEQFATQSTFSNKWLGVAEHSLAQAGTSVVLTTTGRWLRAYGGQVHPNVLGGLLVVTSLATIWLYVASKSQSPSLPKLVARNQWLILVGLAIQVVGLFFSFSRGAWAALLLALAVWCVLHPMLRKHLIVPLVVTATTLAILGCIFWQPTLGRILGGSRLEQQSLDDRVLEAKQSKTLLATAWWRGVGLGNYTGALYTTQPNLPSYGYQPVHNLFVLVLTELGAVGLLLLLYLLWLYVSGPSLRYDIIFLAPILATALLDHYWWTSASMLLLAVVVLTSSKTVTE